MERLRSSRAVRAAAWLCGTVLWLSAFACEPARAFGGLWSSGADTVSQSAEQVLFVDNPDATITAVVRIRFMGPARQFAWLVPVPGSPRVSVSSSVVFERLDAATRPQYWVEQTIENTCRDMQPDAGASLAASPSTEQTGATDVTVLDQGAVDSYQYVTLKVSARSDDPARVALDWLRSSGFVADGGELLTQYLPNGYNLLAVKLNAAAQSGAVRSLMLTYERERPAIPLLPSLHAARAPMPVQVWVFGPSQALAENYRSIVLNDARIDWSSAARFASGTLPANGIGPAGPQLHAPGNYDALVSRAVSEAGGRAFLTELAGPASQYRSKLWSDLDASQLKDLVSQTYADGVDAVVQAKLYYGGWDGWTDTLRGSVTLPKQVSLQAFSDAPAQYRGQVRVDTRKFLRLLREKVVQPVSDVAERLRGTPYLTRLFGVVSPDRSLVDPELTYNPELAQVDRVHIARRTVECQASQSLEEAPWRMVLPQDGVVRGVGAGWPTPAQSMPYNLTVVELSDHGSGSVVADNRETLPVSATTYIEGKHSIFKQYRASDPQGKLPARVTARLRMRPIGQDVLQDLVASGDLDPEIARRMPTLSFGSRIEWTPDTGMMKTVYAPVKSDCTKYECMLDPSLPSCR